MKTTIVARILLLFTCLLAAWQVAIGINGADTLPMFAYTIGFGVLLVAGLLLMILGLEVLESPIVVIISTIIPLSLALGLVWEHLPSLRTVYLLFVVIGFIIVVITRAFTTKRKLSVMILALVHGIAGLTIFLLPIIWSLTGRSTHGFALVGIGGALIGIGGLLLSFLKSGKSLLSKATIYSVLPLLLLLMTASFVAGFLLS
jgi:hypothetical protein